MGCRYQGSSLTRSHTHPAAPAAPSPRRRETSFSLPRRRDSRSLENELLRRRVWGGHHGHSQPPSHPAPTPPRELKQSHPHLLSCITGSACVGGPWGNRWGTLRWDTEKPPGGTEGLERGTHREGRAGPRCSGSPCRAPLLAGTCSVSGRLRPAGGMAWVIWVQIRELPRPGAASQHIWPHPILRASAHGRVGLESDPALPA